jgi:CheY-like chemotaxis protein
MADDTSASAKLFHIGGLRFIGPEEVCVPRVLLVEDSKLIRIMTERSLAKAGHQVMVAIDGEAALNIAAQSHPDVILLDMMLPKLSGPEVLHSLKRNPATAQIPVIVLTSLSPINEPRLRADGAAGFIEKGALFNKPELLSRAIKEALLSSSIAKQAPALVESPISPMSA